MAILQRWTSNGNIIDNNVLDNNGNIIDFPDDNNNSASFKFKQKITGQTGNGS